MSGVHFIKNSGKELAKDEVIRLQLRLGKSEDIVVSLVSTINVRAANISAKFINLDVHARKVLGFFLFLNYHPNCSRVHSFRPAAASHLLGEAQLISDRDFFSGLRSDNYPDIPFRGPPRISIMK